MLQEEDDVEYEEDGITQFTETHLIEFGQTLCIAIYKHLGVEIYDKDESKVCYGLDIDIKWCLHYEAPPE